MNDADIKLVFFEITKEGTPLILSEMEQRLSHYENESKRTLLKQNKVNTLKLDDTYFIAKRIARGSKIRFAIHFLNTAGFQKNYGSGKDVSTETKHDARKGKLTLVMDKSHKTSIHLPGKYPDLKQVSVRPEKSNKN
jgi:uncharacterized protein